MATDIETDIETDPQDGQGTLPVVAETSAPPGPGEVLAVDLSGPGIAVGLVTGSGEIPCSQRIPVGGEPAAEVFEALCAAIDDVLHAGGFDPDDARELAGIGVTAAGTLERESGTVSPDRIGVWRRYALRDRLADRYGAAVRIVADGVAMTIAEHWRGAARGRRNVMGIVASDGLSGGLVVGGALVAGTTGNAGQIGHVCVDPTGPQCACGASGCLQAVAGGAAIAGWFARQPGGDWATMNWDATPFRRPAPSSDQPARAESAAAVRRIAEAAWSGDPLAVAAFRRAGEAIGTAVAGAVTLLDLDVVVVGGPLAAAGSVLFNPVADGYRRHAALGYASLPRVVPAVLGADAALLGAAAVVLHPEEYWPYPD